MTEKRLVINHLEVTYAGIFDFEELLNVLSKSIEERGYKKHEKRFEESVGPEGKNIFIEFRPVKTKTAYYALMIKIRMNLNNVKEVTLEVDGMPTRFQQGGVNMTFDAWTTTKYNQRWGTKPWFYFVKALINKFVYKFPMEEGFIGEVAADTRYVYEQVKSHLNLYKYKVEA